MNGESRSNQKTGVYGSKVIPISLFLANDEWADGVYSYFFKFLLLMRKSETK